MPQNRLTVLWALGAAICSTASLAQTALLQNTFEDDTGGWTTFNGKGSVAITHDAANVKSGKGALEYSYDIKKGEFSIAVLPVPKDRLVKLKSLHFWVKTDHSAPMAVAMQETMGGRYIAMFTPPANAWQEVEIDLSDFVLSTGKDDPKDPDGKLDLDQVDAITLIDVGQMFAQSEDPNLQKLFGVDLGPHKLYLDDFTLSGSSANLGSAIVGGEARLDTLAHPQIAWMAIGGVKLQKVVGKPLEGNNLQATLHEAPGAFAGMIHAVRPGMIEGMGQLSFDVASEKPTKIIVQVEETDGGKYNTLVELKGGSMPMHFDLDFKEFSMADDSKDANDKLDLEKINQILIISIGGTIFNTEQDNKIWIANLRATPRKKT